MENSGIRFLPFVGCILLFLFAAAGFFVTEGKKEKIYAALSFIGIACAIVQAAIAF